MSGSSRRIAVDLETNRLIFVMLKGAKPMRKVAIPITENTTWSAFQSQVRIRCAVCFMAFGNVAEYAQALNVQVMAKLRIQGIQAMNMAAVRYLLVSVSFFQRVVASKFWRVLLFCNTVRLQPLVS